MKKITTLAALAFALSLGAAHAGEAVDGRSKQQNRMKTCNAEAKGKHGDERRAYMKTCLSAKKDGAPVVAKTLPSPVMAKK